MMSEKKPDPPATGSSATAKGEDRCPNDFQSLIYALRQGVISLNDSGFITFVNPFMAQLLGYGAEEMVGMHLFSVVDERHVEECARVLEACREGVEITSELALLHKEGLKIIASVDFAPLPDEGKGSVAAVTDVTHQKWMEDGLRAGEETLRGLLNANSEAHLLLDREGTILMANESVARRFETTVVDLIGTYLFDHVPPDVAKWRRTYFDRVLLTGEPVHFQDTRRGCWYDHYYYPVKNNRGDVHRVAVFTMDISDQRAAETALRDSEARHRAILDAFEGFIYICSKDYRIEFMSPRTVEWLGFDGTGGLCFKVLHGFEKPCDWCVSDRVFEGRTGRWEFLSPRDNRWYYVMNTPIYHHDGRVSKQSMIIDITERKRSEQALLESEARYRRIVDTAVEGIWVMDENYVATFANERLAVMLGYRPEEILGRHISDFIFPADVPAHETRIDERRKGFGAQYEMKLRRSDGNPLWTIISATPVMDDKGRFSGAFAMITDITERKRMEQALQFTQFVVDRAGDPVFITDTDGRFLYVNQMACQALGYTMEELLALDVSAIDPNYPQAAWFKHRDSLKKLKSRTFETLHRRKDGTLFPVEIAVNLISTAEADYNCAISRDISDRKAAEFEIQRLQQEWESIFQGMGHPAAVLDGECRVMAVNRATEQALKRPAIELVGRYCYEIFHGASSRPKDCPFARILESKETETVETDFEILGRTYVVSHTPVIDPHGATSRIIHIATDITERKKTEEALEGATKRLKSLSRSLLEVKEKESTRLARELHDEIGQALTAMKINMQAAERSSEPEFVTNMVHENVRIVDRVLQQVRNLSVELHPTILDDLGLTAALRWYTDWLSQRAGFEGEVVIDGPVRKFPAEIELACFRIVQEALTNVVRHARAKHVTVALMQSNSRVTFSVKDDGAGFDVVGARAKALKGQSLGLIGMEERALLAGGELEVRSRPHAGTEILVHFPLPAGRTERRASKRVKR
jgi:PAS domain S-box-containing protein